MVELSEINACSPQYAFVEQLWLEAFPVDERRDTDAQRANTTDCSLFTCLLATDGGTPAGFMTIWDFGAFCYCEHFATDPSVRGRGLGACIMELALARAGKPMVLEVEMPDDEMSRRRIGFYRRCGFDLAEGFSYTQPPYRPGGAELPMMLMVSGSFPADLLPKAVAMLREHVYGVSA